MRVGLGRSGEANEPRTDLLTPGWAGRQVSPPENSMLGAVGIAVGHRAALLAVYTDSRM